MDTMAATTDALSAVVSTIRTAIGLTKAGRLREQLVAEVLLYESLKKHSDLSEAAEPLSRLILSRALELEETNKQRWKPNWGGAIAGIVCTALVAAVFWFLGVQQEGWWRWPVVVIAGIVGALFLVTSISLVLTKSTLGETSKTSLDAQPTPPIELAE